MQKLSSVQRSFLLHALSSFEAPPSTLSVAASAGRSTLALDYHSISQLNARLRGNCSPLSPMQHLHNSYLINIIPAQNHFPVDFSSFLSKTE